MNEFKMSDEQLGMLLFKAMHEPRRNQKRWIRDCGGVASAEELDRMLGVANRNKKAVSIRDDLEAKRKTLNSAEDEDASSLVVAFMDRVKAAMIERDMKQSDLAVMCGWHPTAISNYFSGKKEPGIRNLLKMLEVLGKELQIKDKNSNKGHLTY